MGGVGVLRPYLSTIVIGGIALVLVAVLVLAALVPGFGRIPATPKVADVGEAISFDLRGSGNPTITMTVTEVEVITLAEHAEWDSEPPIAYRHLEGMDLYLVRFTDGDAHTGDSHLLWRLADTDDNLYQSTLAQLPSEVACAGIAEGCAPVLVPASTEIASARFYGVDPGRRASQLSERWAQWDL